MGFAVCAALLAYALYSQHALGLEPCPLCILQRVAVLATGLAFLGAALHRAGRGGAVAWGVLIALIACVGAAIAARHVWITAQPPGTVAECGASLDYMLEVLPLTEALSMVLDRIRRVRSGRLAISRPLHARVGAHLAAGACGLGSHGQPAASGPQVSESSSTRS